mmetsp:Transcript_61540/g.161654  ORF Transcript_61540/g.161654 Transcript_61540/m.161654 type:complete len:132 (+) Transcript_61540:312-707(+)
MSGFDKPELAGSGLCPTTAGGSGRISEEGREEREQPQPVVGSADMPSRGSALHQWGACKPCAFVVHGACKNDVQCEFCHLCEPGEKKRRRKDWLEHKRETRTSKPEDCVFEDFGPEVHQAPQQVQVHQAPR